MVHDPSRPSLSIQDPLQPEDRVPMGNDPSGPSLHVERIEAENPASTCMREAGLPNHVGLGAAGTHVSVDLLKVVTALSVSFNQGRKKTFTHLHLAMSLRLVSAAQDSLAFVAS